MEIKLIQEKMCDSYAMNPCHLDCESPMLIELRDYASCTVVFYFILFCFILHATFESFHHCRTSLLQKPMISC